MSTSHTALGPTEALCSFICKLSFVDLPGHVVERSKDLVLDYVGVTLLGATLDWSTRLRNVTLLEQGRQESTVLGYGQVPARAAAMVNGAAAHAVEFDDTHDESLGHPGAVVMSAALAMGEALDASGKNFLAALVAGYEAQCRIGAALGRALIERGFHPTATLGVFGSAAAAGHLIGLSGSSLISALGSAASMSSGVMQFSEDPENTMIKRLHAGLPAERGILAVQLASAGFTGPRGAVEGDFGFARVFAGISQLDRITLGLGHHFEMERISVKLYPCCKQFHALIEAIHACRLRDPFSPDEVVAIEPFGPKSMIDTHMEYRCESMMAAQYSLPYVAAASILLDVSSPLAFEADMRHRVDLLALADKVKPVVDQELQAMYPRRFPAGVRIMLRDGRSLSHAVLDARSSPGNPIGHDDIEKKFRILTGPILRPEQQDEIVGVIARLDTTASVRDLAALLRDSLVPVSKVN